jgi:DNA-binding NarL/FixJ family response regulator
MDGTGYHRGLSSANQSLMARVLCAADVYHSLTEARPHRPALDADSAARELQKLVQAGKLDGDAVDYVLSAAGHNVRKVRRKTAAGLSKREVDVLRLLARGLTVRQMALELVISEKTVDSHIQHIYTKINVSTRVGATMFAMEHQLLDAVV